MHTSNITYKMIWSTTSRKNSIQSWQSYFSLHSCANLILYVLFIHCYAMSFIVIAKCHFFWWICNFFDFSFPYRVFMIFKKHITNIQQEQHILWFLFNHQAKKSTLLLTIFSDKWASFSIESVFFFVSLLNLKIKILIWRCKQLNERNVAKSYSRHRCFFENMLNGKKLRNKWKCLYTDFVMRISLNAFTNLFVSALLYRFNEVNNLFVWGIVICLMSINALLLERNVCLTF